MLFNIKKNFKKNPDRSIYEEWATTKTAEGFLNIIDRLPNPDVILRKAGKRISVLKDLAGHYQVGTCIDSRKSGTQSVGWELYKNNCNNKHFELYNSIFKIIDVHRLIENILDAPLYGYNPLEIIWEKDSGYIIPVKIEAKPQEWFYFNSDGEFFFKDRTKNGKRKIDLNGVKFLLPRNKANFENPYGQAILSRCFWNVAFINGGMEFWIKFTEKYGMPYLFGKYDRGMTDKEQNSFLESLVNMVQDAIGLIPNDGSVEVINTGSNANADIYERIINKCENNISKAILGQTLTTDIGSVGSYAASQTHACVRADIVNSDKRLVENTINKLIEYINIINFNDENMPAFHFVGIEDLKIDKAERDNKVKSLGVKFSEDYILKTYGYQKGDIEIVEEENTQRFNFSDSEDKKENDFDKLEKLGKLEDFENIIEPNLKKIIKFFDEIRNAEESLEKLAELYPDFDTKQLEKMLTKVIFIADLMGRLDVQEAHK